MLKVKKIIFSIMGESAFFLCFTSFSVFAHLHIKKKKVAILPSLSMCAYKATITIFLVAMSWCMDSADTLKHNGYELESGGGPVCECTW